MNQEVIGPTQAIAPEAVPQKNGSKMIVILIVAVLIVVIFAVIVMTASNSSNSVADFENVEEVTVLGVPMALSGQVTNTDSESLSVDLFTIEIRGVVIASSVSYTLDEVMISSNVTEILPGESVDIYVVLPEFKDEITISDSSNIEYEIWVYYDGSVQDTKTFDASDMYE